LGRVRRPPRVNKGRIRNGCPRCPEKGWRPKGWQYRKCSLCEGKPISEKLKTAYILLIGEDEAHPEAREVRELRRLFGYDKQRPQ